MAPMVYGLDDLLLDVVDEPTRKFLEKGMEDALNQFIAGKCPSVDFDFSHLWHQAASAFASAMVGGLGYAGIRFLFAVLLKRPERPEYIKMMEFAEYMYGEYGDSTFFGFKYWAWRFRKLSVASVELDRAFCSAKGARKYQDAARIYLLQALIAQAAHVWRDADKHFQLFIELAERKISAAEAALRRNTADQVVYQERVGEHVKTVERLMRDSRTPQYIAAGKLEPFVRSEMGRSASEMRANVAAMILTRTEQAELTAKIERLQTFIALARYRPTLRDSVNYRLERLQEATCRTAFFKVMPKAQRNFVVNAFRWLHGKSSTGGVTVITGQKQIARSS